VHNEYIWESLSLAEGDQADESRAIGESSPRLLPRLIVSSVVIFNLRTSLSRADPEASSP